MKFNLKNLKFYREIRRSKTLHYGHLSFMAIFFLSQYSASIISLPRLFLSLIVLFAYYRFFARTIQNLYYTFWTFSLFLATYIIYQLTHSVSAASTYALFLALLFLLSEMYVLASPIYYPVINWWDYDFRFRYDLKVRALLNDSSVEGRLADLRRQAACLVLFEDLEVAQKVDILFTIEDTEFTPTVEVISKRQHSLGRPYHYGVSFVFTEKFTPDDYQHLNRLWSKRRKQKRTQKSHSTLPKHGI